MTTRLTKNHKNAATLVAATALTAMGLVACSDATETVTSEGVDQTSVVVTETETAPAETAPQPAETAPAEQTQPPATTAEAAPTPANPEGLEELKDSDLAKVQPDSRYLIMGDPSTICVAGDGHGTNFWAGNDNTTCEFVGVVANQLIDGLNATYDNVRDHLKPEIIAHSPVTGEDYRMTCTNEDPYVRCTGGDGAAVYLM